MRRFLEEAKSERKKWNLLEREWLSDTSESEEKGGD
jgi:hypothetical protein